MTSAQRPPDAMAVETKSDGHAALATTPAGLPAETSNPPATTVHAPPQNSPPARSNTRRIAMLVGAAVLLLIAAWYIIPAVHTAMITVSTDDAYVNGHVTFVAPRVAGQVARVLVDDNYRVRKDDLLVELDKEPYRVQLAIAEAAVDTAEADLQAARAQVQGLIAQARGSRFQLEHSMETVRNQVALLKTNVAQQRAAEADLLLARQDFNRAEPLVGKGAISQQEFDKYKAQLTIAQNRLIAADETIQQTRASLGLPINHHEPLNVPENLDQNFSSVREALQQMLRSASQLGYIVSTWNVSPKQALDEFYRQDPDGNLDKIYAKLIPNAPLIKQAEGKLEQAKRDVTQAKLNLRYCDILAEIDGVVTRRNVNKGNYVQVGQSLMAVRSITEIWVDANYKETQLAELRIGQPVRIEVDMYGSRREYEGRISGFTMGTGQTLSLLPPQNATGNFVKIVQRLPVRIDLVNYDPDKAPLFVGLSVTPYVYFKEKATGPHAGDVLQPPQTGITPTTTNEPKAEKKSLPDSAGLPATPTADAATPSEPHVPSGSEAVAR